MENSGDMWINRTVVHYLADKNDLVANNIAIFEIGAEYLPLINKCYVVPCVYVFTRKHRLRQASQSSICAYSLGTMQSSKKEIGAIGEKVASQFLVRKGYSIVECNYLKPWGEIDIIAEKGNIVRFVEVKSVSRESLPHNFEEDNNYRPEEMVHQHKLQKIARTAEMYMNNKNDPRDYQIDVVGVFLDMRTRKARCRLFEQVL